MRTRVAPARRAFCRVSVKISWRLDVKNLVTRLSALSWTRARIGAAGGMAVYVMRGLHDGMGKAEAPPPGGVRGGALTGRRAVQTRRRNSGISSPSPSSWPLTLPALLRITVGLPSAVGTAFSVSMVSTISGGVGAPAASASGPSASPVRS